MLYDPGGTCTVLAYRPAHFCLRPKLEYRLPLVVLTRLNRFTLSHYGSRTPLSTLHAGLTASHARLSTGCLLGFAGSGLSPDYTIHAELAHNFRTLKPVRACPYGALQQPSRQRRVKLKPLKNLRPSGPSTLKPKGACSYGASHQRGGTPEWYMKYMTPCFSLHISRFPLRGSPAKRERMYGAEHR